MRWAVLALALWSGGRTPDAVVVATPEGDVRVPVRLDPVSGPLLPAPPLLSALREDAAEITAPWAELRIGERPFRFLLGAPMLTAATRLQPVAGMAVLRRDTLFLPLQFVSEILPAESGGRFRYDPRTGRLTDTRPAAPAAATSVSILPNGLRTNHVVTIDPGHGGVDPGNPGLYLPRGVQEKHVVLQIGLLLRDELQRRGIGVRMTRTTDTLIDLGKRGPFCKDDCDLFVSLHVNSLPRRRGYTSVRGFETHFLGEARTEDARRVAAMENEAVRFEEPAEGSLSSTGLDFLLRDLQLNEHLRESARLATLMQEHVATAHSGENRGIKQSPFMVLNTARRPAILVELGFGTNPQDGRLLSQSSSQRALAYALADGIVAYLLEYERRSGTGSGSGGGR